MIRVLHIISGGEYAGAEQLVRSTLKMLDPAEFEGHLMCLDRGEFADRVRGQNIKTTVVELRWPWELLRVGQIRRYIRENQIDIVHTHGMRPNVAGRLAGRLEKVPVATTFHSFLKYDYASRMKYRLAYLLTRVFNPMTDRFIAVSDAIREDLAGMGIKRDRISVVYNAVDFNAVSSGNDPDAIRARLGADPRRPLISVIGRLHPVKGHRYFLEAARMMLDAGYDAQFLLAGNGHIREDVAALRQELGLEKDVLMPGYCYEIGDIYKITDIICVPSLMEGFCLVVLEAMYYHIPVVATRVGGITEIVREDQDGLLVPVADAAALAEAMQRILDDPALGARLAASGDQRVKDFQNHKEEMEKIYRELAAGKAAEGKGRI